MSNVENGLADLKQPIADAIMAEAREWGGYYPWFWGKPSREEAEAVLDGELSATLSDEVSRLSQEDREAVIAALVPLVAAEYENQQDHIESIAVHTAEEFSAADLAIFLRDENLTPPQCYEYECALRIRELAEECSLELLEALSSREGATASEAALHRDAMIVRRAIYAERRKLKGQNREDAALKA